MKSRIVSSIAVTLITIIWHGLVFASTNNLATLTVTFAGFGNEPLPADAVSIANPNNLATQATADAVRGALNSSIVRASTSGIPSNLLPSGFDVKPSNAFAPIVAETPTMDLDNPYEAYELSLYKDPSDRPKGNRFVKIGSNIYNSYSRLSMEYINGEFTAALKDTFPAGGVLLQKSNYKIQRGEDDGYPKDTILIIWGNQYQNKRLYALTVQAWQELTRTSEPSLRTKIEPYTTAYLPQLNDFKVSLDFATALEAQRALELVKLIDIRLKAPRAILLGYNKLEYRLKKILPKPPGTHAHHDLPQASRFKAHWKRAGLDNNDPLYGRWVGANRHLSFSRAFNTEWDNFFLGNPRATKQEILNFMNTLRNNPRFQ